MFIIAAKNHHQSSPCEHDDCQGDHDDFEKFHDSDRCPIAPEILSTEEIITPIEWWGIECATRISSRDGVNFSPEIVVEIAASSDDGIDELGYIDDKKTQNDQDQTILSIVLFFLIAHAGDPLEPNIEKS